MAINKNNEPDNENKTSPELEYFGTNRKLENLRNKLNTIKINNPADFIDLAEEFKSIYQTLRDIKEISTKFEGFYINLLKTLNELQNEQLKQSIQIERTKNDAKKALEKGSVNNTNYKPTT